MCVQTADAVGFSFPHGTFEMREGFDKEMDSLLRRRVRGTAESRLWGDGSADGSHSAHLDADELGAFAEGALPAAARVAAASHLADCDRCRGVVVGLARVTGGGAELKQHAVAIPASTEPKRTPAWRALIASLFAPRVMRFAVPVLALSLVGVVSYIALRSNGGAGSQLARENRDGAGTAMKEPAAPAASTTDTMNANSVGLTGQNANAAPNETAAPNVPPASPKGHGSAEARPAEADTPSEEAQPSAAAPAPPPPASVATEGPAVLSKAAPRPTAGEEGEDARADNKEKSGNKEKSARGAEPVEDIASNDAAVQQRRAAQSRVANEMPDGGTRNQQKRGADNNASSVYGNLSGADAAPKESDRERAGSRSEVSARARTAKRAERKADEDDTTRVGETRTAAGHRFRREGSVWVDVNYKSSMPSTGVRRGTDAFRALVADVPEVGRVAEVLSGEVIVVVSGRAYRIR